MKRRIFSVFFALVLVLSMSLVMAAPVGADSPADTDVGYELGKTDSNTALWSTEKEFGNYSVELYWEGGSNAYVEFIPQTGITMDDLDSIVEEWSYWYRIDQAAAGPNMELLFTEPGYDPSDGNGRAEVNIQVVPGYSTNVWAEEDAVANPQVYTFYFVPSDGTEGTVGLSGDADYPLTLGETLVAIDTDDEMVTDGASAATWELTRVRMEIGWGTPTRTCYIDNITIDGTTYELEPIFLDAEFYSVGDPIEVTVPNFGANTDSFRINPVADEIPTPPIKDNWTISVVSSSDPTTEIIVALEETGANTGVFTASFGTSGTPPVAEDEVYVEDGAEITVTYTPSNPWWGAGTTSVAPTITATVDDTPPTIEDDLIVDGETVAPTDGTIIYSTEPVIVATYEDLTSGIDESSVEMTVDSAVVTTAVTGTTVTYQPPESAFDAGDTVEVTVDVKDKAGNAATASWSFTIASDLNVTVFPESYIAGNEEGLVVTITGVDGFGPDGNGDGNDLNWAKVEVSAPVGQSLATGEYYFEGGDLGDADTGDATSVTFSGLLPNDASSDITVTVTGLLDPVEEAEGEAVGPVILTIPVSGYIVTDITPSTFQIIDTTSDISVTVTTKAGEPVSASLVTITAALDDGFEKDVDPASAGLESFKTITINGLTDEIQYDGVNPETCSVIGGVYQVTDITFAELGGVTITVGEVDNLRAKFDPAFSVRGVDVYEVELDPATVTAGVETEVAVTVTDVTEDGDPVTSIDSIELNSDELASASTSTTGEYTITVSESEAGTPVVTVTGEGGQRYGTADLTIGLPTVDYTIYETVGEEEVERNVMLTGVGNDYTITVTVTDALEEALASGKVWLGTYDETATPPLFTALASGAGEVIPEALPLTLEADGTGDIVVVQVGDDLLTAGTLVWKVGSGVNVDDAALILDPNQAITVAEFSYDVNPKEALVGVATTYTVTDNYGDAAGDRDVKIVTPAIETVEKTTGPADTPLAGQFIYTAPEAGDYYVSVKLDDLTWQDAITVTVSGVATIDLYEGANPIHYTGATTDLPGALTNIVDLTEVIWQRDASTGGEWWYYLVPLDHGQITQLENGRVYIVVVSQACTWELPQ